VRNGNACDCRVSGWQGGAGAFTVRRHTHICAAPRLTEPSVHVCVIRSSRRYR